MMLRRCVRILSSCVLLAGAAGAVETDGRKTIRCEGEYPWHLQGTATDGTSLYWSFSDRVIKTDGTGKLVKSSPADKLHYGDLCVVDGTVYVAFNGGAFNQETGADSRVYAFRADDLTKTGEWKVPEVVHGAGGIAYHDGFFYVVGGLPKTHVKNYLYVYTSEFKFVRRIDVESGYTLLGVQAIDFIRGDCLLGVYPQAGSSVGLVRCPLDYSFCESLSLAGYCGMVDYQGCFYQGQALSVNGDESRQAGLLHPTVLPKLVKPRPPRKGKCVAWYRFEEGRVGERTTAATTFSNAADPAKHVGRPYVHVPTSTGADLATVPAELMPEHVEGCARRILDPVTGRSHANARALHFDVKDNEAQTGSPGGTVLVEDDAAFHLQSMTVECFVRIPSVTDTRERLLFGQRSKNNGIFTWCVKYTGNAARVEISIPKAEGGETRLCACGAHDLEDGKWHHLAFTVDAEDGQVRFYEDYRCTQMVSFEGEICYDDALPIMFGPCRKLYYSPLCHDLDEVRITDCALIPDHFLHAASARTRGAK